MKYYHSRFIRIFYYVVTVGILLVPQVGNSDVRADYLINLLKSGSSYRVKLQAAQSLGRIQSKEALPALQEALYDPSPHVVIAAAAALGEIGDPSALLALQKVSKKRHSAAVKTQLAASIRVLQALSPNSPSSPLVGASSGRKFIVKVDAMGNSSRSKTPLIAQIMRELVVSSLRNHMGVEIQDESMTEAQVKREMKKKKVTAFILSGALIKLQQEQNYMVAKIALNVLSNPDYNLVMMPAGEARVPIDFSSVQNAIQDGKGQDIVEKTKQDVISKTEKAVIQKLVNNLIGKILEAAPDVL